MVVTAVESTTLSTVAYDPARKLLQLEFCSGSICEYFAVPTAVHSALLNTPSKGRYFNQAIRGRFPHRRASGSRPDTETPAKHGA